MVFLKNAGIKYDNYYDIILLEGDVMNKTIGKVIDISIPEQYKNGILLDIMDRTNIQFRIMTPDEIKDIILEQNEINSKILKNDLVIITEQIISGKKFTDIELYDGDLDD